MIMYPVANYISEVSTKRKSGRSWYAFSITPRVIASAVTDICEEAKSHVIESDADKWDGHYASPSREFERMVLLALYKVIYHDRVIAAHRKQYNLKGITSFGVIYDLLFSRGSGELGTGSFNSLSNMKIAYCGYREQGLTPEQAWESLGIFGGDDALNADLDLVIYLKVAAWFGQSFKANAIYRDQPDVKFLSRIYGPEVWHGCPDSVCDLPRALSKIHMSTNLPANVTPVMKLVEKCRCLMFTDQYTPILGKFVRTVMNLVDDEVLDSSYVVPEGVRPMTSYNARFRFTENYPQEDDEDWMVAYSYRVLPDYDYSRFKDWCNKVKSLEECLSPPLCIEPRPPVKMPYAAVVDDTVNYPIVKYNFMVPEVNLDPKPAREILTSSPLIDPAVPTSPTLMEQEFKHGGGPEAIKFAPGVNLKAPSGGTVIVCECGESFMLLAKDMKWFQDKKLTPPKRCKKCREARKKEKVGGQA